MDSIRIKIITMVIACISAFGIQAIAIKGLEFHNHLVAKKQIRWLQANVRDDAWTIPPTFSLASDDYRNEIKEIMDNFIAEINKPIEPIIYMER